MPSIQGEALGQSAKQAVLAGQNSMYNPARSNVPWVPLPTPGKSPICIEPVENGFLVECNNDKYVATDLDDLKRVLAQVIMIDRLNASTVSPQEGT
jgi:hypothetical protein